jgi:hypothetical protein
MGFEKNFGDILLDVFEEAIFTVVPVPAMDVFTVMTNGGEHENHFCFPSALFTAWFCSVVKVKCHLVTPSR